MQQYVYIVMYIV